MRETFWHISIIILLGGAVFFINLGGARLWDRDEPRNAGCAAEMMERGNWVVPLFNDELRHQKPVLLYWLIMSAYSVLGVNEFSARFWSAALGLGTALATYGIARRLAGRSIALLAAIILETCLMFDVAARAVTPDSVLIFCSTSAILIYVLGTFRSDDAQPRVSGCWFPQNRLVVIAFYAMLGLAVLAKGPVGFLLPMAMIGLFMLIQTLPETQGKDLQPSDRAWMTRVWNLGYSLLRPFHPIHFLRTLASMKPVMGTVVLLLVAMPWYVLVDRATNGDFTRMFFVGEHFGRATSTLENHSGGIWFYPVAILIGFFPWSVYWGPVLVGLICDRSLQRPRLATCFSLCWVGVQVGAFSLAQTKLPSYVTPCYPALAILTAICLNDLATGKTVVTAKWFYMAFGGLVIAGIGVTVGVGWGTLKFMPGLFWMAGLGMIPVLAGAGLIQLMRKGQERFIPWTMAASALLFCGMLFGFGTVSLDRHQESHLVLDEIADWPEANVASFGCLESSWVFYGRHPIRELALEPLDSQSANGVRDNFWSPQPRTSVEYFIKDDPNALIITTGEYVESLLRRLPDDFCIIQDAEYFLKNERIYLLGRRRSRDGRG